MQQDSPEASAHGQESGSLRLASSPAHKRASSKGAEATEPPRAKRVRVSRACDQCRAGREKCDGAQPSCQTCAGQRRHCSYHEPAKKRGIQPHYIRTLELTLAWIFEAEPASEGRLARLLPDARQRAHRLIAWKDAGPADALHTAWRNSVVCRQIDQLLSGAVIELPSSPSIAERREGEAETQALSGPRAERHAPSGPHTQYQSPPPSAPSDPGAGSVLSPPRAAAGSQVETEGLPRRHARSEGLLRLPQSSWALLEHYFAFTHTWLPVVERHDVWKLMYTYPPEGLHRHDTTAPGHAELWSIMALASLQTGATADFAACRDVARSLVPTEHGFQLAHIKALLILGLTDIMQRAWISAWLMVGSAIRLLTHFHLGKGSSATLSEGRTQHTLLAAFALERALASQSGAITHIRSADIQHVGFLIDDGLEEWSPWQDPTAGATSSTVKAPARSMSTFNELLRMALQSPREQATDPGSTSASSILLTAISGLLHNASDTSQHRHPSQHLAEQKRAHTAHASSSSPQAPPAPRNASPIHLATPFPGNLHDPFTTLPPEPTTKSLTNRPSTHHNHHPHHQFQFQPLIANPCTWPSATTTTNNNNPSLEILLPTSSTFIPDPDPTHPTHPTPTEPDIFEELALLDRTTTDALTHPSFMQNLGFGPDLDLVEFFGADYQFSDPLLSYMQQRGGGQGEGKGEGRREGEEGRDLGLGRRRDGVEGGGGEGGGGGGGDDDLG